MRILWLKTELLHPVERGGRIRTYQMLRALRRSHDVTYLALDDGEGGDDAVRLAEEYSTRLERIPFRQVDKSSWLLYADLLRNLPSALPYAIAKYRSTAMRDAVKRQISSGSIDVVVCDFLAPSQNVPNGLDVPIVLFQHNVEAAIWRRHAEVAGTPLRRFYFGQQYERMRRFEAAECRRFDHVIAVSEQDAEDFRRDYGCEAVSWVPTGVDLDFFRPSSTAIEREPGLIVFTGAMDWLPNEDAMSFFCAEVLPRVRQHRPDARIEIVGRRPSARVLGLHRPNDGVTVVGTVADVRPYLHRASAFVVPIRIGGGTRLKIYEAMAAGCPIVSTTVGAEGLPVSDELHLLFADAADAFAAQLLRLLENPAESASMAARAAAYVEAHFGWDAVARVFAEQCEDAAARRGRP